jgi:hypothetical protein
LAKQHVLHLLQLLLLLLPQLLVPLRLLRLLAHALQLAAHLQQGRLLLRADGLQLADTRMQRRSLVGQSLPLRLGLGQPDTPCPALALTLCVTLTLTLITILVIGEAILFGVADVTTSVSIIAIRVGRRQQAVSAQLGRQASAVASLLVEARLQGIELVEVQSADLALTGRLHLQLVLQSART